MTDEQYENLIKFEENNDNVMLKITQESLWASSLLTQATLTNEFEIMSQSFLHLMENIDKHIFEFLPFDQFLPALSELAQRNDCLESKACIDKLIEKSTETVH